MKAFFLQFQLAADGSELDKAMIGADIKLIAKCKGVPNDKKVSVKMYHKSYTDDTDLIKKWDAVTVTDEKISVPWKVEYVAKKPDKTTDENSYIEPEYVFVVESREFEFKEESSAIEIKDFIEIELKNPKTGAAIPNGEFTLTYPDGDTEDCQADQNGFFRKENIMPGGYDFKLKNMPGVKKIKWTKDGNDVTEAMVGDKVKMTIEFENIPNDEEMDIAIYEKDYDGKNDLIKEYKTPKFKVQDNKIEFEWDVIYVEDNDDKASKKELATKGYTLPEYITVVKSEAYGFAVESPVLNVKDFIEIELLDENNNALANTKFKIVLKDGTEFKAESDASGKAKIEKILVGNYSIIFGHEDSNK